MLSMNHAVSTQHAVRIRWLLVLNELKKSGGFEINDKGLFKGLRVCKLGTHLGKIPKVS